MRYQDLLANKDFDAVIEDDKFYDASMNPRAKSSKHLKEVIIPELRAKAEYYRIRWQQLRTNNLTKREISKKINVKKREELHTAKKQLFGKAQTKINIRAYEMYFDKIKLHKLERSNYLDGALSYPIIKEFLKHNKTLTEGEFRVFMVFYCHKWMLISDCEYFGFEKKFFRRTMLSLIDKGFAQQITVQRKKAYSSSINSSGYFKSYIFFSRKRIVKLFNELDKKQPKREGGNWLKYNGKVTTNLDFYEATNISGLDEGTG